MSNRKMKAAKLADDKTLVSEIGFRKCTKYKHALTGAPLLNTCVFRSALNDEKPKIPIKNICVKRNVSKQRFDALDSDGYFDAIDKRKFNCTGGMCALTMLGSDSSNRDKRLLDQAYKFTSKGGRTNPHFTHCILEENDKDHRNCDLIQFHGKNQFNKMVNGIPLGSEAYVTEVYGPAGKRRSHSFRVIAHKGSDGKRDVRFSTNFIEPLGRHGKQRYEKYKESEYFRDRPDYSFFVGVKLKDEDYICDKDKFFTSKGRFSVAVDNKSELELKKWHYGNENTIDLTEFESEKPADLYMKSKHVPKEALIRKREERRKREKREKKFFDDFYNLKD